MAESGAEARTTRWASLHVVGNATARAWVVPVVGGAYVDAASDAWMEALEAASAPRILPPNQPAPCGPAGGVDIEGSLDHVFTVAPTSVAVAPDTATLAMLLATWGLQESPQVAAGLGAAAAPGTAFVVLGYMNPPVDMVTRTVRVVDSSPLGVPLSLVQGASPATTVTAYLFSPSGAAAGAPRPSPSIPGGFSGRDTAPPTTRPWPLRPSAPRQVPGSSMHRGTASSSVPPGSRAARSSRASTRPTTAAPRPMGTWSTPAPAPKVRRKRRWPRRPSLQPARQGHSPGLASADARRRSHRARSIRASCAAGASPMTSLSPCRGSLPDRPGSRERGVSFPAGSSARTRLCRDRQRQPSGPAVFTAAQYAESCGTPPTQATATPPANTTTRGSGSSGSSAPSAAVRRRLEGAADVASNSDSCSCGDNEGEDSSGDSCGSDSSGSSDSGGCSGSAGDDSGGGCSGGGSPDCAAAERRHRPRSNVSRVLVALAFVAAVGRRSRRPRRG